MRVRSKETFNAVKMAGLKSITEIKSILSDDSKMQAVLDDELRLIINDELTVTDGQYIVVNGNDIHIFNEEEFHKKYERVRNRSKKEVVNE